MAPSTPSKGAEASNAARRSETKDQLDFLKAFRIGLHLEGRPTISTPGNLRDRSDEVFVPTTETVKPGILPPGHVEAVRKIRKLAQVRELQSHCGQPAIIVYFIDIGDEWWAHQGSNLGPAD